MSWEPFDQPIRGEVADGAPQWRDNAWLCFWDGERDLFGEFHVSTTSNGTGRRSRCSVFLDGNSVEIVEELAPASFVSGSIDFSAVDRVSARSERLIVEIGMAPRFALGDFSQRGTLIPLVPGEPLQHFQRAATVTGTIAMDGRSVALDGVGFRDRTWGYRDESASWAEYMGINAVFPDFAVTSMRFKGTDGSLAMEGYLLDDAGSTEITAMSVTRDARGLLAAIGLELAGGGRLDLRAGDGRGFWVPMGPERTGPTMSSYAEFVPVLSADGLEGVGRFEQGILRTLY